MADAAVGIGKSAASAAAEKAKKKYVEQSIGQYNEIDVKNAILSELQLIKEDTEALRHKEFRTARDRLRTWHESEEPLQSEARRALLKEVSSNAALAVNAVPDPLDKMSAIAFLIYADYHRIALSSSTNVGGPNWSAGKRGAQKLLAQYITDMQELRSSAREELGLSKRRFFKDKAKRRRLLLAFVNLSASVFALCPPSENTTHPKFEQLEEAAIHAYGKDQEVMMSVSIHHMLAEPLESNTLEGHTDEGHIAHHVYCCYVYADGTRAISGGGDTLFKIWDLEKGTRAISGSMDNTLKVWDLEKGKVMHTLEGHTDSVRCCAVYADGTRAISGSHDKTLKVWDLEKGEVMHTLKGHTDWVVDCCTVYNDGMRAISGSADRTLKVWDLEKGKVVQTLKGHTYTGAVLCCAVYAEGTRAISGSMDNTLKVWDLEKGEVMHTLEGHTGAVLCCAVYADGTRAISGSCDNTLKVWDLEKGEVMHTLEGHTGYVNCCAVNADGTRAISGSSDSTLKVWEIEKGEMMHILEGHTSYVNCCAVNADGTRAISGSNDKTLKVWDVPVPANPRISRDLLVSGHSD